MPLRYQKVIKANETGRGTVLGRNGTPLMVIAGSDFAAAYFGIWLGREPIDETLKRDLLKGR